MFSDQVVKEIVATARRDQIDPASLLAVSEVESAGRPLESDNLTPRLLFERHVFYRELKKRNKDALAKAVSQGLATPKWDRSVAYRDQGTSQGRLAVLAKARAVDEECANRACSWGLGQVLGANAESLGYSSANNMVNELQAGGIVAQVESMLRFIKKNHLQPYLNLHDWASFALKYNGPGYAQNRYDVRMAAAYQKWVVKIDGMAIETEQLETNKPVEEKIDELPPPYVEPQTKAKSTTLWSTIFGTISTFFIGIWTWFMNLPFQDKALILGFMGFVVLLFVYIAKERIRKIVEDHV